MSDQDEKVALEKSEEKLQSSENEDVNEKQSEQNLQNSSSQPPEQLDAGM